MTINQTLDKIEEHVAGILPAFMMIGFVVFLLLVLGVIIAPVSADVYTIVDESIDFGGGEIIGNTTNNSVLTFEGVASYVPLVEPHRGNYYPVSYAQFYYSIDEGFICEKLGLESIDVFDGGTWSWGSYSGDISVSSSGEVSLDDFPSEIPIPDLDDDGYCDDCEGDSDECPSCNIELYSNIDSHGFHFVFYEDGSYGADIDALCSDSCGEHYMHSACVGVFVSINGLDGSEFFSHVVSCPGFEEGPVYLYANSDSSISSGSGSSSSGNITQGVSITYDDSSDTYSFILGRNGKPSYVAIKGYVFGWIPVYTYTTVQDESLDLSLTGLPSRFLGLFDIQYIANVYTAGGGLEGDSYVYRWSRVDCFDDDGNYLSPDISGSREEPVDFESLVKPPSFVVQDGYDTPGINDIDHDGIPNDEDDDMDGDGIPNEEDDRPYSPGNSGILGSLGFTLDFTLPDIESIQLMMKNMKLPGSLKEMFNIILPDEYKANIAVEETHVLYGYQQIWFGIGDGVIGLVMGVVLVLAALVACIPRFLWEFFSSLIEWLNVAFLNFYDWLVIPSEIFKLVIDLLPDEVLALALLLFGVDLVFLFFRFVIPGMISGSHAIGDIVEKDEKMRLIDEFGEETYNKLYGKKRGGK